MFHIPKVKLKHKKVKRRSRDKVPNNNDFTISDSADAPVAPTRIKKYAISQTAPVACPDDVEPSWETIFDENLDIDLNISDDGASSISCQKQATGPQSDCQQNVYPEILWYLISKHVAPEDICRFASINKAAFACTQRAYFWHSLYTRYCENHIRLPEKYRLENGFHKYGLRQRVIRALFHTYGVFRQRIFANQERPHTLVGRKCIKAWQSKGSINCFYYIKLKKVCPLQRVNTQIKCSVFEELEKVDANPEEGCKVLQVTSKAASVLPFLMGMNLCSVNTYQAETYSYQRLHLGFTTSLAINKQMPPECLVILESVATAVYDWWHPNYPYFDNTLPISCFDEDAPPLLGTDFFNM